jgi:hypothetical protein
MAVKRYRVTGTATVLGHAPNTTFEADLPPEQEAPLLKIGAIQEVVVPSHRDEKPKKQKEK